MPIAPEYLHMVHPDVVFDALLYGRASRDPKKKGRSVADQIATGREMCEAYNWPIAEVFDQDVDRSASRHAKRKRRDFEALIESIEAGRGRIVVAFEASRYYRDVEAYILLRNACMNNNVLLCYNGQVYDLSKREDRKATAMDAIAAEDEAEGIRDRNLRTTRATAKKGTPHGRVLYGYARRYDPDSGELIEQYEHPERGPIVLDIFKRIAAGETEYSIVRSLREDGERLPGIKWDLYHLRTMLRNPGYAGQRVFQGEVIGKASWPAIVPQELFDQVQQIVGDESRKTTKDWSVKHLLSGIARCGECGDRPHLRTVKTRRGARAYQCSQGYHTMMRTELLEGYVEEALLGWLRLIKKAKQETEVVEAPPLVRGLIGAEDVDDRWEALAVEQQRTVVRACVNVRLNRARARGVRSIEPGRITLVFAGEEGFRAQQRHVRVSAHAKGQGPASEASPGTG